MATSKQKLAQNLLKPGVWVRWESQSQGSWVSKQGEVLVHVPARTRLAATYTLGDKVLKTPKGLTTTSQHDRTVMAVVVNERTGHRRLYVPTTSLLVDNGTLMDKQEVKNLLKASTKK